MPRAIQAFGATGMVTTLLRITMAMEASTNQGMDGAASHLVKAKVATNVAAMTPTPARPTCVTCEAINCCQSKMMPSSRTRFRLNVTPGLAQAGVPKTLLGVMPISVARIIGLRMATPGMRRRAKARRVPQPAKINRFYRTIRQ